jgi:pimeloyl-ACP methyl ester carboxylesterase
MPHITCNNASLFYTDEGTGNETLVFSHGLLMSNEMFRAQIDYFKSHYRCIAYDHRGQGKSEVTKSGYDMDSLYLDAVALIENLQLDPVHFIGLSMGGFVGMRLAARKPHLVKSLILMGTSADDEANKLKYRALNLIFQVEGKKLIYKRILSILFGKSFLNDPTREKEKLYWTNHIVGLPRTIGKAVSAVIDRPGIFNEITTIKTPTLMLVGDEDVATPVDKANRIHRQIQGSVLQLIPQGGHSACIEQPEEVNRLMERFLNNLLSR